MIDDRKREIRLEGRRERDAREGGTRRRLRNVRDAGPTGGWTKKKPALASSPIRITVGIRGIPRSLKRLLLPLARYRFIRAAATALLFVPRSQIIRDKVPFSLSLVKPLVTVNFLPERPRAGLNARQNDRAVGVTRDLTINWFVRAANATNRLGGRKS